MRILIDAMGAPAEGGGMNRYATEVVSSWVETYPDDDLVLVGGTWCTDLAEALHAPRLRVVAVAATGAPVRFFVQVFLVAWLRVRLRCDLVLSVSPLVSFLVPRRRRACVSHDWRHRDRPEEFGLAQRAYRSLWALSVHGAGTVFCISAKTEQELLSFAPRARSVVVPNGGDHPRRWARAVPDDDAFRVLTFGHWINKRPELVVDAVTRLGSAGRPVELTLLGARGEFRDELTARVPAGWAGRLDCPGFVPEAEYHRLLQRSDVVCLMSSDEGFGLPAVEAGHFGIPCVVATDSGMTEIHPSGLTVSEPDADALAAVLERLREAPERAASVPCVPWSSTVSGLRDRLQQCLRDADTPARCSVRSLLVLIVGLLPPSSWKNGLLNLLGHDVDPTATIAPVVIMGRTRLFVGPQASIGALNAFRDVSVVRIGAACEIGQLNWFTAAPFLVDGSPNPDAAVFEMGEAASLTNRHYVDAAGGVFLGAYSLVAGVRSTFMTHGVDVADNSMSTKAIRVGERSMVGSNCLLLPGAMVPDRSVLAMGSTAVAALQGEEQLFAGAPAKAKKTLPASRFWIRTDGPVLPFWH